MEKNRSGLFVYYRRLVLLRASGLNGAKLSNDYSLSPRGLRAQPRVSSLGKIGQRR